MKTFKKTGSRFFSALACLFGLLDSQAATAQASTELKLTPEGTFHTQGLDVLVFNNVYEGLFSDAKISGIELIHHDVRTATNGDVRLHPTPPQWSELPVLRKRELLKEDGSMRIRMAYPAYDFEYCIVVKPRGSSLDIAVELEKELPAKLVGVAGFNLELLPSAYFRRGFLADGRPGAFPLHPSSSMGKFADGSLAPEALATGAKFVLAPEDPERRISIETEAPAKLSLFDGRSIAQNGWFVVRSALPANKTGTVLSWHLEAALKPDWQRPAVIGHSQVGYACNRAKRAVLELDTTAEAAPMVRLLRLCEDGAETTVLESKARPLGRYLRYQYAEFDFTEVSQAGLYRLEGAGAKSASFRISETPYEGAWEPSLDVFLPVQMDHLAVREAYRVWHGHSHRDDARQAPVNHTHFDLYTQGPKTDSKYAPGEHIPGLNIGGWLDAGDFDIRTQTQYALVSSLVHLWEDFRPERDQMTVDRGLSLVTLHTPDGIPDVLQQIEHGVLGLLAQHRVFGRAIPGIVEPDLVQYTHLGDAASKTDGRIFDAGLQPGEEKADKSGTPDDRWAFTGKSTPLNYGSAAALAAAARALRGYRDELAEECIQTAVRVWDEEHSHPPQLFRSGNTTGGELESEELRCAIELLKCTGEKRFAERIQQLWGSVEKRFEANVLFVARIIGQLDPEYRERLHKLALAYRQRPLPPDCQNPYQLPITTQSWAGSSVVLRYALVHYTLHKLYPQDFSADTVFRGLEFLHGCHPGSDISLVSAVGTRSKEVAYGNNRADFSFIAGGIVPGILIIKPDFPENKEDWPFFWGENEYVVSLAGSYLYLVHAANSLCVVK